MTTRRITAIAKAIEHCDTQVGLVQALAEQGIQIRQQTVSLWLAKGYAPKKYHDALVAVCPTLSHKQLKNDLKIAHEV